MHRGGDLIVVSAPEGGETPNRHGCSVNWCAATVSRWWCCRRASGHIASADGALGRPPRIMPRTDIVRGTHPPDQDVICSSGELSRLEMAAEGESVSLSGFDPETMTLWVFPLGPLPTGSASMDEYLFSPGR
ncbi:hypothetical protein [Methanogenium cariaci]|uniref:hypothetical protein n=1 Tax=Methanogenium cariaci TaxID=2197 RepID=UPI000780B382|nr:hypothetical protein [Methanogenium cariaci]